MNREKQLHEAIESGNYADCMKLLQIKPDIINKVYNKKYPLCLACENDNYEIVELLIKNGANVNQLDLYDQSALAYAIDMADIKIVKLLINSGANVNTFDINGIYPLHVAINKKNDELCDYLIDQGALINVADKEGCSLLSLALVNDYVYMIHRLLKLGADPNISDYNGDTPLIKAIWLTSSSSIEPDEITRICKKLVECGAEVNTKNENGRSALFTAIYENNTDVALFLIQNGATIEIDDTENNFTLLHYACYQGNYTLAKVLLEKNCDPNAMSSSGESPIYIATTKGYMDIVALLVDYGAKVNIIFGTLAVNKCTLLQASVYYIRDFTVFKGIADKLVKANINLGVSDPVPILNVCLQYNKINFAKYLLANGAPIDNSATYYQSCFYKAFLMRNIEFMELCLKAGFSLKKMVPWIEDYIECPSLEDDDRYQSSNYRLIQLFRNHNAIKDQSDDEEIEAAEIDDEVNEINSIMRKTDDEIAELLMIDEFFLEKYHAKTRKLAQRKPKEDPRKKDMELAQNTYSLIKHYYTNPLSLQELARIQIRNSMLKIDYKIKFKVENKLPLPNRLKNFLLFKEFNC